MSKKQKAGVTRQIFALRREGHLDEAYALCRESFGDFGTLEDKWEVAAVGWTVIDLVKRDLSAGKDCSDYFYDLMSLHVEDDELLAEHLNRILRNPEIVQARALAKEGRLDESDALYRKLWEETRNREAAEGLGWNCSDRMRIALENDAPDIDAAVRAADTYLALELQEPSEGLCARMENRAAQLAKAAGKSFSLLDYLVKTDGFSAPGHWYKVAGNESGIFHDEAVIETAVKEAIDRLSGKRGRCDDEMTVFIETSVAKTFSQYLWNSMSSQNVLLFGKLELLLKKTDIALDAAFRLLKRSVAQGPANELAGDALLQDEPASSAAFYAAAVRSDTKALAARCTVKLVSALIAAGLVKEAQAVLCKAKADAAAAGKKAAKDLLELEVKIASAESASELGEAVLVRLSAEAEKRLLSGVPEMTGNFCRIQRIRSNFSKEGTEVASFALKMPNEGLRIVTVPPAQLKGFEAEPGAPVMVKCSFADESHVRILAVRSRTEGHPWDCLQKTSDVSVEHVLEDQQIIICRGRKKEKIIVPFWLPDNCGFEVKAGDILRVRMAVWYSSSSDSRLAVDAVRVGRDENSLEKEAVGTLSVSGDGLSGSVKNENGDPAVVGIPREVMLIAGNVKNGGRVSVKLVKRGKKFKAVSMRRIDENGTVLNTATETQRNDSSQAMPPWEDSVEGQPTPDIPLHIWTDGACKGNPGVGGWGVLMLWGSQKKEIFGGARQTTNNRMELTAVISALSALKRSVPIVIHTDSTYVRNGIVAWISDWKDEGWRNSSGKTVKNVELWKQLDRLVHQHSIEWQWVKGHAGDPGNERADELANMGCETV